MTHGEAGLVHRLDTFTSGVLIAARNERVWTAMRALFSAKAVEKTYIALVAGQVTSGSCDGPLSRRGSHVCVTQTGLPARTEWQPLERLGGFTLLRCATHHGRRHQVRVHLAHVGHPIAGDAKYGGAALPDLAGQFLHASTVTFVHPIDNKQLMVRAPLTAAQEALLARLRRERDKIGVREQE